MTDKVIELNNTGDWQRDGEKFIVVSHSGFKSDEDADKWLEQSFKDWHKYKQSTSYTVDNLPEYDPDSPITDLIPYSLKPKRVDFSDKYWEVFENIIKNLKDEYQEDGYMWNRASEILWKHGFVNLHQKWDNDE